MERRRRPLLHTVLALLCSSLLAGTASARDSLPLAAAANDTATPPQRIVSLSLCADDLLLDLVPDQRIAAVSRLAADGRYSRHADRASALVRHDGLAEQIIALQPDLVLAADYEQGKATQLLKQFGYPVQVLTTPRHLAEVPPLIRQLATLLGVRAVAEQRLQRWQQRMQRHALAVTANAPLAISLAPNAYTPGRRSLKNELLRWTGYRTAADQLGFDWDQALALEQIVQLLAKQPPAFLLLEEQQGNRAALAYQQQMHPALLQQDPRSVAFDSRSWLCAGFGLADAAEQLASLRTTAVMATATTARETAP